MTGPKGHRKGDICNELFFGGRCSLARSLASGGRYTFFFCLVSVHVVKTKTWAASERVVDDEDGAVRVERYFCLRGRTWVGMRTFSFKKNLYIYFSLSPSSRESRTGRTIWLLQIERDMIYI